MEQEKQWTQEQAGCRQQNATRAVFFIDGFGNSSWAPMVPLLQERLRIGEDILGLLLLCIGLGSLLTMPLAGVAAARFGCRRVLTVSIFCYALLLGLLSVVSSFWLIVPALLGFGAAMGIVDVVSNIHAVTVEQAAGRRLMSGMQALWSVGGFAGAGLFSIWLQLGFSSHMASGIAAALMLVLLLLFRPHLLRYGGTREGAAWFAVPRGIVGFIGIVAFITFLVEGAMMDWGGVFLTTVRGLDIAMAGTGFAVFSSAMLIMRLSGDWLVRRLGAQLIVLGGSLLAAAGFLFIIFAPGIMLLYTGFFFIGVGLANIVPTFYSMLGRQQIMPLNMAVSAVSTVGYLGILMGPALIGFIAQQTSLYVSFGLLTVLVLAQMAIARFVYQRIL